MDNIPSIISNVVEDISRLGNEIEIINDTRDLHLFYKYENNSKLNIPTLKPIQGEVNQYAGNLVEIKLNVKNLEDFLKQIVTIVNNTMIKWKLVKSIDETQIIIDHMKHNPNPDSIELLSDYVDNFGNSIKRGFEMYLHPISMAMIVPSLFTGFFVEPFVTKQRDKENIQSMYDFVLYDTLLSKHIAYIEFIRDFLISYHKLYQIYIKHRCCRFIYQIDGNGIGITDIQEIKPKESIQLLNGIMIAMADLIKESLNFNSYDVYRAISLLYNEFIHECNQRYTFRQGVEAINQFNNGRDIHQILDDLINDRITVTDENEELQIVEKSQIAALTMMKIALKGRGLLSNSDFNLFGLIITANSISDDHEICVLEKDKIENANESIPLFLLHKISDSEKQSTLEIGKFDHENFVDIVYKYFNEIKCEYNKKIDQFMIEFDNNIQYIKSILPNQSISNELQERIRLLNLLTSLLNQSNI